MNQRKIFLKALSQLEKGRWHYCCSALNYSDATSIEMSFFADLFKPKSYHPYEDGYWGNGDGYWGNCYLKRNQDARKLALEFAQIIFDEGGL